jgi:hypothetical protein
MSSASLSLKVYLYAVRFVVGNFGGILRRAAIPVLVGIVASYLLLASYLHQISSYLESPSGGGASKVLGIAALGLLVMLFLHSQMVGAVAGVLLERKGRPFMGIWLHEWRLFVASLQLLLIVCAYAVVFWPAQAAVAGMLSLPPLANLALKLSLLAVLFWIGVRAWFFLLPLCVSAGEGEMLRRSWQSSAGHFWKITVLLLLIGPVVLLFHAVLQFLFWLFNAVPPLPSTISIGAALDVHRQLLLPFVLLMSGTYIPAAVLSTVARIRLYQELTGAARPAP